MQQDHIVSLDTKLPAHNLSGEWTSNHLLEVEAANASFLKHVNDM